MFPDSTHVRLQGLASADDLTVWEFAKQGGFVIISKDADFRQLSFLHGYPPKVVWLRVANQSTVGIEALVRGRVADFVAFQEDPDAALLVLTG